MGKGGKTKMNIVGGKVRIIGWFKMKSSKVKADEEE